MDNIIEMHDGIPMTTSDIVADGTRVQRKNVLELIRKNIADLSEFGRVRFKTLTFETNGGMQNREIAILNEPQTTLLITYMRNNEIVRAFKLALVKAFYQMREVFAAPSPVSDLGQVLELDKVLEKMVVVRETRQTKGKAAASRIWDMLGLPQVTDDANVSRVKADYKEGECYRLVEHLLANPPYAALSVGQIVRYIQRQAVGRVKAIDIKRLIVRAHLPNVSVMVNKKTYRAKILTEDYLTNEQIRAAIEAFERDFG